MLLKSIPLNVKKKTKKKNLKDSFFQTENYSILKIYYYAITLSNIETKGEKDHNYIYIYNALILQIL